MAAVKRARPPLVRSIAILLFSALVLFVVWFRAEPLTASGSQDIAFTPIAAGRSAVDALTPFELSGAWQLTGDPALVTGLSGLDVMPGGRLIAVGDRGSRVIIAPSGGAEQGRHWVGSLGKSPDHPAEIGDAETVAVDPVTGRFWTALETDNRIVLYGPD